ncbi:MAG: metal ABC transporter substrate-binding protein [Dehalococcoidia bacterium]|nr:metal ABC transporter substrate-binding protein [Dehalococcoidia bacterium]MDP6228768.1 metal ABC transporter substrate-binding protein [Dehalococcoidia bacterium]MDP7083621.1 metal ABC transporter substrate-binding protein [Dehalococcoidia bacterium]MDP7511649.1 metal ABC transporter substrate-binding protein [Dehalococcoidia bacterium]HJN85888.1 metal ABC transporter substrate-binding protein [Dehalococcoidia bacterium]
MDTKIKLAFFGAGSVPGLLGRAPVQPALAWALVAAFWLLAACGGDEAKTIGPAGDDSRLQVITTTVLLADLVKNVGGSRVEVRSIVPPGADVHSFQTTPTDSINISQAAVIVSNGLELDAFLEPVLRAASGAGAVHVVASEGLEGSIEGRPADEPQYLAGDPHYWQNPLLTIHSVERVRDSLAGADPDHASEYRANAEAYIQELRDLDLDISQTLSQVGPDRRHLVTFHDAFRHFGWRYGWQVSSFVSSDAGDVIPAAIVAVLDQVADGGLPAVFVEPQFRSEVIERAAQDAGVAVGTIYSDVLDEDVSTYIEMMRANARTLAEYLK